MEKVIFKQRAFRAGALLALTAVLLSGSLSLGRVRAQSQTQPQAEDEPLRTISVSGTGRVSARPDTAVILVGVRTEAETAVDALAQNNQQTRSLLDALTGAGIAAADLQTQSIQLQPRFEQTSGQSTEAPSGQLTQSPQINGFTAANILQVRVREIDNLGSILDEAVTAGGNSIEGVYFEIDNATELEDQARTLAIADARRKAEQMAEAVDASVGEVISISEGSASPIAFGQVREAAGGAGDVPVMTGSQEVFVSVQVTWRLVAGSAGGSPGTGATPTAAATRTPAVTQTPSATRTPAATPNVTGTVPTPAAANLNELVGALRGAGATVRIGDEIQQPFFSVAGQAVSVNGADVQVFEFRTETERQSASSLISESGDMIGNSIPSWIGRPNFWANGRLIVLFVGDDAQMISLLSRVLGEPLTGGTGEQGGGQELPAAAVKAQQELATRLGVQASLVEVFSVTEEEWTDSCLGLGGPAESCLQVITPGYLVRLRANGQQYEARTDRDGTVIRWR